MTGLLGQIIGQKNARALHQNYNAFRRQLLPKREIEQSVLPKLIEPGFTAFEVGANYGQYLCDLSPLVGSDGEIHAFEPAEITFNCLARICRLRGLKNVTLHHMALSDAAGTAELHTPIKPNGKFGVAQASLGRESDVQNVTEIIRMETMDAMVAQHNIEKLDFVRCDVEGAELKVLQGGVETIKNYRPIFLMEVHPPMLPMFGHSEADVNAFFKDNDYFAYRVDGNRLRQVPELDLDNFFFFPVEKSDKAAAITF